MMSSPRPLLRFCLDLLALAVLAGSVAAIAAYHLFGGVAGALSQRMVLFAFLAPIFASVPVMLYAALRLLHLERQNGHLFHEATRDGLTQVLNRSAFKRAAQAELARLDRGSFEAATLLVIDADHFKRINDRLGHPVGDAALSAIARTLRRSVRRNDLVGRLGGEEFAVLLQGAGSEEAAVVAERLRALVERLAVGPPDRRTQLSVSIGGVSLRTRVAFDAIYKIADTNLYQAKQTGRNRAVLSRVGSLGRGGLRIETVPSLPRPARIEAERDDPRLRA